MAMLFVLCLSISNGFAQNNEYHAAYNYIYKSKELSSFLEEIRIGHGIIIRKVFVSDCVIANDPYPFLCSILRKKIKSNETCTQMIASDKLKTYDSIKLEYKNYSYSKKFTLPIQPISKRKKGLIISFSLPCKNTICAALQFYLKNGKDSDGLKSILFYFVFHPDHKIKTVYSTDIQNNTLK